MYKKGSIKIVEPVCEHYKQEGWCIEDHKHQLYGTKEGEPVAYLPHSCDEWVIGGEKEILQLIEDLQEALKRLKSV